jgi:N-acetylmuramoyl-L-alanine amidase
MSMWKTFGRGFDSRRLHHVIILLILLPSILFAEEEHLTIFEGAKKSQIPLQNIEGNPYVSVAALQPFFGFEMKPIAENQSLSIIVGTHNILLSANRALVSVDEKLVSLNFPVYIAQSIWYVPLDFIPKVLKATSDKRILWLENSRSLMLGDVLPNEITLKYATEDQRSRIVFQTSRPIQYSVAMEGNNLVVTPLGEDYVVGFKDSPFTDGILKNITIAATGKKQFQITVDEGYGSYKSFELTDPPRLVVDFYRKAVGTEQKIPVPQEEIPPKQAIPPTLLPSTAREKWVVVIDPGHGGSETGAKGQDDTFEKDIVLSIAHKLKSILEGNSGTRVVLTRDGDQLVNLDDRTALANNNKADLFISIHANSTVRGYAKGAETYFLSAQATDNEARNSAAVENNAIGLTESPNVEGDLKLILWDMAQTEFLAESSQLAEAIQQELNSTLSIENRGIKQAPFRVLMGATMPAVLVEVGFINNPEEEKLMKDSDYQLKIARAIFRSIQKFRSMQEANTTQLNQTGN